MKIFLPAVAASVMLTLNGGTDALNVKIPGVNYSPFKAAVTAPDSERCKSEEEVQKNLVALKEVTDKIRITSLVECNQADLVLPAAKNAGLRVQVGLRVTKDPSTFSQEKDKLRSIIEKGLFDDTVIAVCVGSNSIHDGEVTAQTIIDNLLEIRSYFQSLGKNVSITTADSDITYSKSSVLRTTVDFMSVNFFAIREIGKVNDAAARTLDRLNIGYSVEPAVEISETGWPSSGSAPNTEIGSLEGQTRFFSDLYLATQARNVTFYWYTGFDLPRDSNNSTSEFEASFGIFDEDNTMKSNFQQLTIYPKEPRVIRSSGGLHLSVDPLLGNIVIMMDMSSNIHQQTWFTDSSTPLVRSLAGRCLTATRDVDGAIVRVAMCDENDASQLWRFDRETGWLKHIGYQNKCLDTDPAQKNKVQIWTCTPNNPNQIWSVLLPYKT
ncbi:Ricin B lectin domain [Plasmopara halstedii]|uniref:glucan endo-1,3-beta-D-glucosidase n=1 Tax=Plasmopara halstedii TaxID=4781 RepID=A0A0P1B351_PLAHL|nr:Ricin B lectin domain [Plasmopara halstedii]CEG48282.1 Ricin B lectin domain [Plasmopara halstedii]|eukprot:XP_024584651.1 Ricin B lectin domain [Plasmopara halstedii]